MKNTLKNGLLSLFFILISVAVVAQKEVDKKVLKYCDEAKKAINLSDFKKAENLLQKAFDKDTTYFDLYIVRGDIYSARMKSELAAESYLKAIKFSETPKPLLYFLAAGEELRCGKYQEAYTHYQIYVSQVG
ncbi:MAG: hypothetical protein LBV46_02135, partial [Bacteroidales bacterium]|nr:hypothetical protein [Bacteroidales bacterium]